MSDANELAAAIERLASYCDFGGEFISDEPEPNDECSEWRDNHAQSDLWTIGVAYLRETDPSPITPELLLADGWAETDVGYVLHGIHLVEAQGGWTAFAKRVGSVIVITIGQVRTLLRAFGEGA